MKREGVSLEVSKDVEGPRGEILEDDWEIVDSVFVRGLTTDRKKNGHPSDYRVWKDEGEMVS